MRALGAPYLPFFVGKTALWLLGRGPNRGQTLPSSFERILVARVDGIGDAVLMSPLIRELRYNFPLAWITWVVCPLVHNLVEHCPHVNEVLTCSRDYSPFFYPVKAQWRAIRLARSHLWKRRFDLAICPRWGADTSAAPFLAFYSGASWRQAYSERVNEDRRKHNRGFDRLFTHVLGCTSVKHEVEHNLNMLRYLGGTISSTSLELWLSTEDEEWAAKRLEDRAESSNRLSIGFGIASALRRRMWPTARFIHLGARLKAKHACRIILLGGAAQESEAEKIERALGADVLNLVGKATLRQCGAILKRIDLFVSHDSGLMHIASAAGIPVVEISCHPKSAPPDHTNSPELFGPRTNLYRICRPNLPLAPCKHGCESFDAHCILGVTVDEVESQVSFLLNSPQHPPSPGARTSASETTKGILI